MTEPNKPSGADGPVDAAGIHDEDPNSPFNESCVPFLSGSQLAQAVAEAREKLSTATVALFTALPYYGPLLFGMRPVFSQYFPAAAGVTPDGNLMLHPGMIAAMDLTEVARVLLHECGHLRDKSSARSAAMLGSALDPYSPDLSPADRELYKMQNIAADIPINDDIEDLEGPGAMSHHYCTSRSCDINREKSFSQEDIFPILVNRKLKNMNGPKQGGNCGSGGGGAAWKAEQGMRKEGRMKERSEAEMDAMLNSFAQAIRDKASQAPGTVPGNLLRWADLKLRPPQVKWQTLLKNSISHAVQRKKGERYPTFSKLPRIQAGLGYGPGSPRMPSYYAPGTEVHFWQDTSGSMSTEEFAPTLAEIKGILSRMPHVKVHFGSIDAQMYKSEAVASVNDIKRKGLIQGGGGTVFTELFQHYAKMERRKRPAAVVIATDGYIADLPRHYAAVPVIWLVTPNGSTELGFGKVIKMKN
jgi:predicted metal-dependent peptidase